jgi:hypothetical protein
MIAQSNQKAPPAATGINFYEDIENVKNKMGKIFSRALESLENVNGNLPIYWINLKIS